LGPAERAVASLLRPLPYWLFQTSAPLRSYLRRKDVPLRFPDTNTASVPIANAVISEVCGSPKLCVQTRLPLRSYLDSSATDESQAIQDLRRNLLHRVRTHRQREQLWNYGRSVSQTASSRGSGVAIEPD